MFCVCSIFTIMNYYSKALITCFKPQILNRKVENPTEYPQRVVRDRVFFPMHKTQTHCVAELVLFGQLKCTSLQLTYITRFIVSFSIEWIFFSSFLLLKFPLFALTSFNYFFFAFFCFCCFSFFQIVFPVIKQNEKRNLWRYNSIDGTHGKLQCCFCSNLN